MTKKMSPPEGCRYIFVKSYRHPKTGKLMVAAHYGLKAFRFAVKDDGPKK
jgi:hypothetical protein